MVLCSQCDQQNVPEEIYCVACGAALENSSPAPVLSPLPLGTILAETYLIESSDSLDFENRYRAVCLDEPHHRVFLRERSRDGADILQSLSERVANVSHPALVIPERFFEHDDRVYLTFPEIVGTKLSSRVGRTTEREAVSWGIQLCQMISAIQRSGFVCIELPPDGVLLDKEGRVRLAHIESLSRIADPLSLSVIVDGYAAPEVYKSAIIAKTSVDVFAIGALLFSLVVGKRLPVEGWAVQAEPLLFYPEKIVSPDLERVLRKALAVDPQQRYDSVDALKAALLMLARFPRVRSAWFTDVGQVRDHNEDAVFVREDAQGTVSEKTFAGLYVVSDGMGGAEAGEVASALTIQTIARCIEKAWSNGLVQEDELRASCLREALETANTALLAYAHEHPEAAGLGATVVAALVYEQQLTLAWVGDSRGYLWEQGVLRQLSRDHSLVARLVEIGQLSPEAARTHEHRNVLLRSLGSKEQVVADVINCPLRRGARLLLCSDGLTGHVEDDALQDILSRHRDPYDAVLEFVAAANSGGGSDNISVIVVFHE